MNIFDLTLEQILELFELFGLVEDVTLKEVISSLENDFEWYDDAEDIYYEYIKYEYSDKDIIEVLESGIDNSFNWNDVISEFDEEDIKEFGRGYVRYKR